MRIYPAVALHDGRAVGGLQPDEHDPGAARRWARRTSPTTAPTGSAPRALMQGLADGYFVLPYTIGHYLASDQARRRSTRATPSAKAALASSRSARSRLLGDQGHGAPSTSFHRELGKIMWEHCGMARNKQGLETALAEDPGAARGVLEGRQRAGQRARSSTSRSRWPAASPTSSSSAELMCRDALEREESCGGHFREEYQTPDGEALRDDEHFCHVAAWEWKGEGQAARAPRRAARVRERPPADEKLQVSGTMNLTLHVWRQKNADAPRPVRDLRGARASAPTCRSSRCSTSSTRS